jgi:3-ketosteroid 9alpha-monooxygenase subunit A
MSRMIEESTLGPVARIVAQPIPDRYARGWHYVGLDSDFSQHPKRVESFGTQLVAYRGEDGGIHILDGYCPHMGGDLSKGCVEGNSVRCPFHEWRWGSDGICNDIPYAKSIPVKARIKQWLTLLVNDMVFVWHDPEDRLPAQEVTIPDLGLAGSDEWTSWVVRKTRISTNCRELIDNVSDVAHFASVHHSAAFQFKNIFEGHIATQIMKGKNDDKSSFDESSEMHSHATYYGPAVMFVDMKQTINSQHVDSVWMNAHVPIDLNSFNLYFGVMMKKTAGMTEEENRAFQLEYVRASQEAFDEDIAIWDSKTRVDNPVLCDGDGPINLLRQWYDQFYVDVGEVPEKWKTTREYTV